jgi:hypothetical protein
MIIQPDTRTIALDTRWSFFPKSVKGDNNGAKSSKGREYLRERLEQLRLHKRLHWHPTQPSYCPLTLPVHAQRSAK